MPGSGDVPSELGVAIIRCAAATHGTGVGPRPQACCLAAELDQGKGPHAGKFTKENAPVSLLSPLASRR